MKTIELTSKQYFRSLIIIFFALLMGQIIFVLLALFINSTIPNKENMVELVDVFLYIVPVSVIGGLLASIIIPNKKLKAAKERDGLKSKLEDYQALTIIKLALLEGQAFFAIVIYLITAEILFLGFGMIITLVFLIQVPRKRKVTIDLELNQNERKLLDNPSYIIN